MECSGTPVAEVFLNFYCAIYFYFAPLSGDGMNSGFPGLV